MKLLKNLMCFLFFSLKFYEMSNPYKFKQLSQYLLFMRQNSYIFFLNHKAVLQTGTMTLKVKKCKNCVAIRERTFARTLINIRAIRFR